MAITQRTQLNPQQGATNWAAGVGRSGSKWLNGVMTPRQLPNANPANATANWTAGVSAAAPSYSAGLSSPNYLTRLASGATAKQGSYTGAGQAHQADYATAAGKLYPLITNALSTLPPKGPRGTNSSRSTAFQQAMHAQKGNAKANR